MEAPPPAEEPFQPKQSPPRDCLICFAPIRRNIPLWIQATPVACACRPPIHRACWHAWAAQAGPICIICRSQKYLPAPPQQHHPHHDGPILFGHPISRTTSCLIIAIIVYLVIGFMGHLQPNVRPTYYRHDEL